MNNEQGAPVEWKWQEKTEALWENPVALPLCPPQIPHGLVWHWVRALKLRGRRLTVWAMAQPPAICYNNKQNIYVSPAAWNKICQHPKMCLHTTQRKTHLFSNWGLENMQLTDRTALLSAIVPTQFPSLGFLNWWVATQNKGRDIVYWGVPFTHIYFVPWVDGLKLVWSMRRVLCQSEGS